MANRNQEVVSGNKAQSLGKVPSRNEVALGAFFALIYRKDGSGTGGGLAKQAFMYADAFLAEVKNA